MQLLVTLVFERAIKKLRPRQKSELDEAVHTIADHPESSLKLLAFAVEPHL